MKPPSQTSWLWRLAILIGLVAAGAIFAIKQDQGMMNAEQTISMIVLVASVSIGVCVISATAHLWLKR